MMKRLLSQIKDSRKLLGISAGFGCLGGLILIAEAYILANIVNLVFMEEAVLYDVRVWLLILLAVIVGRALLQIISEYTASKVAQKIKATLRTALFQKLDQLGPQYLKKEQSGELMSTVYEGVEQLESYLAKYVPQIALSMFVPFAVFVIVAGLDWFSALVFAVTLPLLVLFMILIGKYTKLRTDRQYKLLGRLGGHFQEVLQGIETLKIFNRSEGQKPILAAISEQHRKSTMAALKLAFLSAFVMELFATLSTAIVAVFLGLRLISGDIPFYDAFLVLLLAPEFYAPIRALGTQFHAGMNGASAATRLFRILDTESSALMEQREGVAQPPRDPRGYEIAFEDVTLRYDGAEHAALSHVSFTLAPGSRLALVGATGSGKSTLLDLLQGFLQPSGGTIYVDGIALQQWSIAYLRRQFAVLSQSAHLFNGTIRENIEAGLEQTTDEQIEEIVRQAGASEFVASCPSGLETPIGDAIALSGGQIQRLAIARMLLRKQASLVLLDEATRGLDWLHQEQVGTALDAFLEGKSSIIVTHQLHVAEQADYVLVFKQGRIVEQGTPRQLHRMNGVYTALASSYSAEPGAHASPAAVIPIQPASTTELLKQTDVQQHLPLRSAHTWKALFMKLLLFIAPYKGYACFAILLSFATVAANIGLMGTSGYLIAKAALRPENVLMIYVPIVGVRFFGIARGMLRYAERLASHNMTFKVLHRMRIWLYEKIEPVGITLLQSKRSGDILGRIVSDIEQLQHFYLRLVSPPVVFLLTLIGGSLFFAMQERRLMIAFVLLYGCCGILLPLLSARSGNKTGAAVISARSRLYELTHDTLKGLQTLQQYGLFQHYQQRFAAEQEKLNRLQLKEHRSNALFAGLSTGLAGITMWTMLLLAIPFISAELIPAYMLPAIILVALACFEAAAPLPQAFRIAPAIMASAERLVELGESGSAEGIQRRAAQGEDEQQESSRAARTKISRRRMEQAPLSAAMRNTDADTPWSCELNRVYFKYEEASLYALKDFSLKLEQGKRVAIVGESGGGKSTVLQALLQLRPIEAGSYRINEAEASAYTAEAIRSQFSVVTQQVQLFNTSVLDNIRLGNKEASFEEVKTAAKLAEIDTFIEALPQGYHTMIGEFGAKLSGGQRQRLALARALLKPSAALLLDEPSTGLDVLTQKAFLNNLLSLPGHRAMLWITHQLADITEMDEIIVMRNGLIVERGTHQQLLASGAYYATLWKLEQYHIQQNKLLG
ncbi:thiol reductant ABC exporter subunit CydD [Paenibacillus sp. HB172176]|uniref:thiol reductant ABC exporter subunit CydD n=1 Tax=Paenibacillus sp. HB172176 TaxID=2493690 RepID=UPI00143BEA40|nr:thiol reductant ABC exporter subunit CydD [Paenibacillus sp. HB172176]